MTKKTAGVEALVEEVLQTVNPPYSEDIIEDVFVLIDGRARRQNSFQSCFLPHVFRITMQN